MAYYVPRKTDDLLGIDLNQSSVVQPVEAVRTLPSKVLYENDQSPREVNHTRLLRRQG